MQGTEHQLTMAATHCHLSTLLSPPLTKQVLKTGAFANLRGNSVKFPPLQVRKDDHKRSLVTRPMVSSVGESHTLTESNQEKKDIGIVSIHHVGLLCENLEKSLDFYQNLLGLEINEARPHGKLPYRGAWLWVGSEMIHLMELPNPDPLTGRPEHGGRDRHACIAIKNVTKLKDIFDQAGINYTLSRSGRPAIFARDPDGNALEFTQVD